MNKIALKIGRSSVIFFYFFVTFYQSRMTPGDARVLSAFVKHSKPNNRWQMDVIK